ncbi:hypothetical protein [Marinobacter sp. C2H3]|uniref:hypothetical protein n=1 Tax=Marinobacter sp. C2H3 TaxID=3119003 RepID=UPI00300F570F
MKTLALVAAILACHSIVAHAAGEITAAYSGMKFQVPDAPVVVASLGQKNDILLVKYSNAPGKRYISFSTENSMDKGGCSGSDFFEATLSDANNNGCNPASVASFRAVFVKESNAETWENTDHAYYYFPSEERPSFVFFESDSGDLIKLESDFLDRTGFRQLLGLD